MKRFLALLLIFALLLSACGQREEPPASSPAEPPPSASSGEPGAQLPTQPAPTEETAKALTDAILQFALYPRAEKGWQGEADLLDLSTFAIQAAVRPQHPYHGWFPMEEETGLYCFPREALERMAWEVFGLELPWKEGEFLDWNGEQDRWQSTLEFGTRWPAFQAQGEMTAAWQDEDALTVAVSISEAGTVDGGPGFLPLGDAVFTYRRMNSEGREFLRLERVKIEEYPREPENYPEYRYDTVPGVEIPEVPIGMLFSYDGYTGYQYTIDEPSAIRAILDLWGKIRILDAPVDPPTPERPFGMTYTQFFASPEDETPVFTLYRDPFCVEVGDRRSAYYRLDDSSPEEELGYLRQIYGELDGAVLKRGAPFGESGKLLYQIPFRGDDDTRRTINFFLPSDWTAQGDAVAGPGEKKLSFAAYRPDSEAWKEVSAPFDGQEPSWIATRNYWVTREEAAPMTTRQYFFCEKGVCYRLTFTQSLERYPLEAEQLDRMLWDMVYIQHRGPDEMADVVLDEQRILE